MHCNSEVGILMDYRQDQLNEGQSTNTGPAILPIALARASVRAYDTLDPDDAEPAVRAAEKVAAGFAAAITAYRQAVDPPA